MYRHSLSFWISLTAKTKVLFEACIVALVHTGRPSLMNPEELNLSKRIRTAGLLRLNIVCFLTGHFSACPNWYAPLWNVPNAFRRAEAMLVLDYLRGKTSQFIAGDAHIA